MYFTEGVVRPQDEANWYADHMNLTLMTSNGWVTIVAKAPAEAAANPCTIDARVPVTGGNSIAGERAPTRFLVQIRAVIVIGSVKVTYMIHA